MKTTVILSVITTAVLGLAKAADSKTTQKQTLSEAKSNIPAEEKKFSELTEAQKMEFAEKNLASRMMTPKEVAESGLGEQLRREKEARRKDAALHLPAFKKLQPMIATIKDDQELTVFEALPHQVFEPEQYAAELKTKETVERHGFHFYKTPIKLSAEDVRKLNALMKHPDSFGPYLAVNGPGGFQPDFALVWDSNGKPIEVLICFGNGGEIKAYQGKVYIYCQMDESKEVLKSMLKNDHKNRPRAKDE